MIVLEFQGSVIEGQNIPHHPEDALLVFRIQRPVGISYVEPLFGGEPLEHIARAAAWMGRDTSITTEYEVRSSGDLVIVSHMNLEAGPRTFRLGVQEMESGILILEEDPEPFPWFIDGDFIEPSGDGTRSLFCPRHVASVPAEGDPLLRRLLGDDQF